MTPEEIIEQKRWDAEFLAVADILEHGSKRGVSLMLKGVQVEISAPTPYGLLEGRKRAREIMLDRVGPRPGRDPAWELVVYLTEAATLIGIVGAISPAALAAAIPAAKKLVGSLKSSGLAPDLEDLGVGALKGLPMIAKMWAFLNGRKMAIGLILAFIPELTEHVPPIMAALGVGGAAGLAFVKVLGWVTTVLGAAHKVAKG
jgi:hypothetical protein